MDLIEQLGEGKLEIILMIKFHIKQYHFFFLRKPSMDKNKRGTQHLFSEAY